MVPTSTLILMAVNALLGFAIPVCLAVWLVRKHHARISTILIGAGTFIVFALVLESLMHQLVLKGPHGASIMGNTLRYALYGGLAAGIFEETGRFLSMKFLMKKEPAKPLPGVAYGVGHGGVEMLIIFGITMINNLVISALINSGQADAIFAKVPEEAAGQLQVQLDQLQTLGAGTLLVGLWERISALILHLGLSLLVWVAVRKGGKWLWLFPAAIALHALVDAGAVLLQKSAGMVTLELIVTAEALAVAAIGYLVAKKL
ncbi:MAG: YhfC family intramembrane metalloprotease [Bacteroidales bacterium]|nr:YhfC family intramembrane metalloprotease [Bacteroidales bacterium]MBQ7610786.1 YhfC family intramembrane metalloprotease [Bacteroidales bacterium]